MGSLGVFGYGSLVLPASASMTLGRDLSGSTTAHLRGWKRRFSQARDNRTCEKTFELADGSCPEWILGLNVQLGEDPAGPVNGVVIELSEAELERLGIREIRYDLVDVTDLVTGPDAKSEDLPDRIVTFTAKPAHFAPKPPADAVILATYATTVEQAFEALGPGELDRYLATTGPCPVEKVEATLVRDRIPEGNPRAW